MFRNIFRGLNRSTKLVRRGILVFAVFVTIIHLFTYFMNQDKLSLPKNNFDIQRKGLYTMVKDPKLQKTEAGKKQVALYRFLLCASIGETCTDNVKDGDTYFKQSLMGRASSLLVKPYSTPPASGLAWSYEGLAQAGFIPATHAQGIGFYALQPLAPIWKVFRNLSYMLLVLVIVSIGFMIMFRSNVSAQTVISIENSLPRIVIALLLITFSFPIAGFMIDLMYILMGLGGSVIINNIGVTGNADQAKQVGDMLGWQGDIFNQSGWGLLGKIIGNSNIWLTGPALLSLVPWELQFILRYVVGSSAIAVYAWANPTFDNIRKGTMVKGIPFIGEALGTLLGGIISSIILGLIVGLLVPLILSVVVWITCLMLFFRIFFMLLMTYTRILLSIIFSPFVLLFEAFPGTSTFGYWFKGLFFNLLTFPIVAILIMVSGMIANISQLNFIILGDLPSNTFGQNAAASFWRPPFLYTIEANGFVMLVAISMLFIIPDIVAFVKKSFGVEDLPFSVSPGDLLAGGSVLTGGAMGLMMKSKSLSREFGYYRDNGATQGPLRKMLNPFLAENPNEYYKKMIENQTKQPDSK
ncbi:hypothetical protein BH09PAT2_BH09PAT2_00320 [soil metagenome]